MYDKNCNTDNEVNLRTINGKLALTAKYGKYFDFESTTATIISKMIFPINKTIIIRLRASVPIFTGLVPRVLLFSHRYNYWTILNFNQTHWYGIDNEFLTKAKISSINNSTDFREYQEYELKVEGENKNDKKFTWLINGREVYSIKRHSSTRCFECKLAITLTVDKDFINMNQLSKNNSCHTFLIDYIKVYQMNETDIIKDNITEHDNAPELCTRIMSYENESFVKFKPENYSRTLFFDDFIEKDLDENKWLIKGYSTKVPLKHILKCFRNKSGR